jgi:hypothetical protein
VGEIGSPVDRVVLSGETRPEGAKERVLRSDSGVASTALGSFSYSASSWISWRIVWTSAVPCELLTRGGVEG